VRVAQTGPTNVEIWNATAGTLLRRKTVPQTDGIQTVHVFFSVHREFPRHLYGGVGPFELEPVPPATRDDNFEVRVWTPGHEVVNVYSIAVQKVHESKGSDNRDH
jgi:hypothetical protein